MQISASPYDESNKNVNVWEPNVVNTYCLPTTTLNFDEYKQF